MAAVSKTYRAVVTREGDDWLADVPDLQGASTFATTLRRLQENIREVIILADDLAEDAEVAIALKFDLDDPAVQQAVQVHERRDRLDQEAEDLRRDTAAAIRVLLDEGYSVRDTAAIVGVTAGRVSQLANA